MSSHTIHDLYQMQGLPLSIKISMTKRRIRDWVNYYGESGVYISFSGGKDSTVLLHMAREMYPNLKACFVDTGLEFPEIRQFVKSFDNVDIVKPKMGFKAVCEKYGFPLISKEVSECVYGARKYLTKILEENSLAQTDRQTDRQTEYPYWYWFDRVCGLGKYAKSDIGGARDRIENSEESQNLSLIELMEKNAEKIQHHGDSEQYVESLRLKTLLIKDFETGIDNQRIQILMGCLTPQGKATKESIPSKANRSMFSLERWQFFLDAPFEISNKCCDVMKKNPIHSYAKKTGRKPITAQMASESRLRTQKWLQNGCNAFDLKEPISNPMSFWTEQDVLLYVKTQNIPIASVYGDIVIDYAGMGQLEGQMSIADFMTASEQEQFDLAKPLLKTTGCHRTGCILCGFGCHLEKGEGRFERLKKTHPNVYKALDVVQNSGVTYRQAIDWINENNGKGKIIYY